MMSMEIRKYHKKVDFIKKVDIKDITFKGTKVKPSHGGWGCG